jgi:predicted ATPase/class 3 adenylate cyclase
VSTLPTGTVTFLFTDIEGSTRLLDRLRGDYATLLADQRRILRQAFANWQGREVDTQGDAFFVAFSRATQAVCAAVEAQRGLAEHAWPGGAEVRVRMGIHTGEPSNAEEGYVGMDVHRAARIAHVGHGGQVLLSETTAALVRDDLPDGVSLCDLGRHLLKDIHRPERIFQITAPGLQENFPALNSLDHSLDKLPLPLTRLIGRVRELEALKRLIDEHRLVTLTGPGGSGKTHLSLVAARKLSANFKDGVYFIPLEALSDVNFVTANVARTLGLREQQDEDALLTLKKHLQRKQCLLILDNFEHILPAVSVLAELLENCPKIKLLTTSREALRLSGEQLLPIPPMSLPSPHQIQEVDKLIQFEAVKLFVERAQAVQPDFEITVENATSIAELCILLDGLPLAIELAAARVRMLSPQAMLSIMREKNRTASLRLLTHGSREKQARQRTLRATIDWSYQLLDEKEKLFFRRLAVFVGGFNLMAAENLWGSESEYDPETPGLTVDVLDGIETLVDKNLIRPDFEIGREPRYSMLKTIQEYGLELLENHQETEVLSEKHALYYHSLARNAESYLETDEQVAWFDRLEADHGNLMAALRWASEHENAKIGFEIALPLVIFWFVRGYFREGRKILDNLLLIQDDNCPPMLRAKALDKAGFLARYQQDYDRAFTLIQESLTIRRKYQDQQGEADALASLGFIMLWQGDYTQSEKYYQTSFDIYDRLNNQQGMADTLVHLSMGNYHQGNYVSAQEKIEKCLDIWENLGDQQGVAYVLPKLGNIYLQKGDLSNAQKTLTRALTLSHDIGFQIGIATSLEGLARLATIAGNHSYALQLLGAAKAMRQQFALPMPVSEQMDLEAALRPAHQSMNDEEVQIRLKEGERANIDEFIPPVIPHHFS